MIKLHLRILYGCDNRLKDVTECISVSREYFDTVGITNTGPIEFYENLKQELPDDILINHQTAFFDIDTSRRLLISDVPHDDWVLWLDADERPSQELLSNIRNICESSDSEGVCIIQLPWWQHTNGVSDPPYEDMIKTLSAATFRANRLMKNLKELSLHSNFGAHEHFTMPNVKTKQYDYPVLHFKSALRCHQSVVFSAFLNPLVHSSITLDSLDSLFKSDEFIRLRNFQKKHSTFTSTDMVRKIAIENDLDYLEELKELFLSFPSKDDDTSDVPLAMKWMNSFAKEYNMDIFNETFPKCGEPCCKYKNVQL